jgi:hypothetical protein
MMAHYWFESLLKREGLDVPEWSRQEMEEAIQNRPMGLTRDRESFQQKLKKWKIVSRRPPAPARNSTNRSTSQRILDR